LETKNFVDLIKKFGNEKQSEEIHSNIPSYLNEIYPYGQFPSNRTKNGQKDNINTQNSSNNQFVVQQFSQPKDNTQNHQNCHIHNQNYNNNTQSQNQSQSQNQGQEQGQSQGIFDGMDLKTLLPLMMNLQNKDKFNATDMFSLLMPTLGGDNPNMKELMKIFTQNKSKQTDSEKKITPSKMKSIDSYIKV